MHESHPLFAELMTERLWAITPDALSSLDAMLASSNGKDTAPAPRAAATASHGGGPLLYAVREGVAVIDISGTIHRYGDPEWDAIGHDTIKAAVSLAMQDRSASALLLRFNSPGGVASGVPELAAWLAAQTAKPVYAYADGLCASAAYYLAAATGRVYAPATATVGSIGVICRHMDWSGFLEKCGVRVTHLTGGAWKAAGNDAEPLTDEVKAYLQQPINELHTMFRADVAAHMPVDASAPETWGDGQVFLASRAHELGLVTGIVAGMDALIALINTTKEKPMDRIELASSHPELLAQIEADAKKQGAAGCAGRPRQPHGPVRGSCRSRSRPSRGNAGRRRHHLRAASGARGVAPLPRARFRADCRNPGATGHPRPPDRPDARPPRHQRRAQERRHGLNHRPHRVPVRSRPCRKSHRTSAGSS